MMCGMKTVARTAASLLAALVACASCAAPAAKNAHAPKWDLKFTENFSAASLNEKLWTRIEGDPRSGADWLKNISSRRDLSEVKGGILHLKGVRNDDLSSDPRRVLAGGVSTKGLFNMKYGKIEARIRLEAQKGAWPAFWMMPESPSVRWPDCGEIDIFERLNSDPFVHHTVHSVWTKAHPGDPPNTARGEIRPDAWNIYALEWTPDAIVWRVNGRQTHSYRKTGDGRGKWPWDAPFYIMLDMQLGGKWVGEVDESTLPAEMQVDWVKFYQLTIGGKRTSEFTKPGRARSPARSAGARTSRGS